MAISESRYRPFSGREGAAVPTPSAAATSEAALYGPVTGQQAPGAALGRYRPTVWGQRPEQEVVRLTVPASLQDRWERVVQRLRVLRRSQSSASECAGCSEYDSFRRVKDMVEQMAASAWESEIGVMELRLHLVDNVADAICAPKEDAPDQEPEPPDAAA